MRSSIASIPRVAIGHANPPSSSGDCAWVTVDERGRMICFLGDVAGHGPSAAILARAVEARVARIAHALSCGALLTKLNTAFETSSKSDRFVSAVCFSFDTSTGRGSLAVAGQLPPIVKGLDGARPLDAAGGPGLGMLAAYRYVETEFVLRSGDIVVALTDGITDAFASPSDLLGLAAATRLIDDVPAVPNRICASLLDAAGTDGFRDDATILVAAHRPFDAMYPAFEAPGSPRWPERVRVVTT